MSLGRLHARVYEENRHLIDGNGCQKQLDGERVSKHVRVRPLVQLCPLEQPLQLACQQLLARWCRPLPVKKKYREFVCLTSRKTSIT